MKGTWHCAHFRSTPTALYFTILTLVLPLLASSIQHYRDFNYELSVYLTEVDDISDSVQSRLECDRMINSTFSRFSSFSHTVLIPKCRLEGNEWPIQVA